MRFMESRRGLVALFIVLAGVAELTLGAAPAVALDRFEDWEVSCASPSSASTPAKDNKKLCRMTQNHVDQKSGRTVLLFTLVKGRTGRMNVIVSVPMGIYLPPGITISIDGSERFRLLFETCNQSGCHGGYELSAQTLGAFRRGLVAQHSFYTAKNNRVDIPVSLKGFSKAFSRLKTLST